MTLDGDHHHHQMTGGDHPLVVSRANPAAAVVSQGRAAQVQAREIGVHHQTHGVHLPRVRAERVAVAVVNRVRAEVDLEMDGDLILVHGDQVPAVRVARAAQAAVNRVRAEVDQATGVRSNCDFVICAHLMLNIFSRYPFFSS